MLSATTRAAMPRARILLAVLVVAVLAALAQLGGPISSRAAAAAPTALINGDTVSSGSASLEATTLVGQGWTVDVVDGATWTAMTAAQFGAYDLLVIGDPTCSVLAASATGNASTWAPVVMGSAGGRTTAGNRILIGTDPVFHQGQGGSKLIAAGLTFAGQTRGTTGLYLDFSCSDASSAGLAALDLLTSSPGAWTSNATPPCGGAVSLIARNPAFSTLTTADIQGWSCSVHETFPTYPGDWTPLAVATDTVTKPTCGTDVDSGAAACGEAYVLVAGAGIVATAPNLALTPLTAVNPVGTTHTVTATVTNDAGAKLAGVPVGFVVTGANAGAMGTCVPADCTTPADGRVTFTYTGLVAGDDTINASITVSGTSQRATAAKTWVAGEPTLSVTCSDFHGKTLTSGSTLKKGTWFTCSSSGGSGSWTSTGGIRRMSAATGASATFKARRLGASSVSVTVGSASAAASFTVVP